MRRRPLLSVVLFGVSSTTLFFTIGLFRTLFWHNDDDTSLHRAALHKAFNASSHILSNTNTHTGIHTGIHTGVSGVGRYNSSCIRVLPKGRFGAGDDGVCVTAEYYFEMSIGGAKIGELPRVRHMFRAGGVHREVLQGRRIPSGGTRLRDSGRL